MCTIIIFVKFVRLTFNANPENGSKPSLFDHFAMYIYPLNIYSSTVYSHHYTICPHNIVFHSIFGLIHYILTPLCLFLLDIHPQYHFVLHTYPHLYHPLCILIPLFHPSLLAPLYGVFIPLLSDLPSCFVYSTCYTTFHYFFPLLYHLALSIPPAIPPFIVYSPC